MNILFIVGEFPKISETFILNQITGLIDQGHSVSILAKKPEKELKQHFDVDKYNLISSCIYYSIPKRFDKRVFKAFFKSLSSLPKTPKAILKSLNFVKYGKEALSLRLFYSALALIDNDKKDFDIIHCHFGPNGILGACLKDIGVINGKVYTTFHGNDMTTYIKNNGDKCYNFLFKKGDFFLPISKFWEEKLIHLGCEPTNIIVHKMGVDLSKFNSYVKKDREDTEFNIVTVARFVEKKGVEYAIHAISQLVKQGQKIKYQIIGDGPLYDSINSLINNYGLADNINILGWKEQEEVIDIMKNSDLLLAPSVTSADGDMEGIPVVLMESMAMKVPVMSTYHSGIPELIEDGRNGFLVAEKDIDGLTEKLEFVIRNKNLLNEMGIKGRKSIEEVYDITKLNKKLETIFLT
ncbi:glycosyltransferase [Bacillus sp. ISL-75]|uniref:glycosyltransferase n=1 Tax=Bacillus sp. ISL-75 TaxID=2819137 RepID=UPI001BEACE3A|nr:glycosyltransferase [Bacillus sp. ISL-75]MBT2730138.1 glycosyltransferase [Bacillus sp. ISL-75]